MEENVVTRKGEVSDEQTPSNTTTGDQELNDDNIVTTDYTKFGLFFQSLVMFALQVIEFLVWGLMNTTVLFFFLIAGIVSFLLKLVGFEILLNSISYFYPLVLPGETGPEKIRPLSSISIWTPQLYSTMNYAELADAYFKVENDDKQTPLDKFCPNRALMLCYFSSLAYENPPVVKKVVKHWGNNQLKFLCNREVSCTCYIFYDIKRRLVITTFKGTSPFNLTEWLTDAVMYKVRPKWAHNLPGLVHQGIYNALFDPADRRYHKILNHIDTAFDKLIEDQPDAPINFWVTGHSLGAGLAAFFTSILVTPKLDHPSVNDPKFKPRYDLVKNLRGVYTFGSPRCGDNDFAEQIEQFRLEKNVALFRVRNANDVIPILPLGAQDFFTTQYFFKNNSWAAGLVKRPQGPLNYQHFGTPIWLSYFSDTYQQRDPTYGERFRNIGCYLVFVFSNIFSTSTLYSKVSRLFTPNLMHDHYPSEYIRHLYNCAHKFTKLD